MDFLEDDDLLDDLINIVQTDATQVCYPFFLINLSFSQLFDEWFLKQKI